MRPFVAFAAALSALAAGSAVAQETVFVTCPIYRDTDNGRKSGCWLAEDPDSGVRYDVTVSDNKPDWARAVLVEGRLAADQTDVCGGPVLDPVRVSVLDQPCVRAMIPAEGYPGRLFVLPARTVRPLYAPHTPAAAPWTVRDFVVPFDFERDFVTYQNADFLLDQAVWYALDTDAARIEVTGLYDDRDQTVSGVRLRETEAIAQARAERVKEWFRLRGVDPDRVHIAWRAARTDSADPAFEGLTAGSRRRVDIRIHPSTDSETPHAQ